MEISNFFSTIKIKALNKVVDNPKSNTFHVSINKFHVLDFVISDQVKSEAKNVIQWLRKHNYKVIMASTDSNDLCYDTAAEVEIP